MDIVETASDGAVTLALKGRLDGASANGFEATVLKHIDAGATRLIVDLAELDYLSSMGLRVFMLAAKRLKAVGGRIVLCALQPSVRQIVDIAGFATIFAIAGTREDAAALLAS